MNGGTWLITGATGFLGRHLMRELARDSSIRAVGLCRNGVNPPPGLTEFVTIRTHSEGAWESALTYVQPSVIIHLAGRTPPATRDTLEHDNVELTRILISTLEHLKSPVRFVHCGSAAELGDVPAERLPADESIEPRPVSDYGQSKWSATRIVMNAKPPIEPVVGRIFNVFGPGQPVNQVFGRYAREFAAAGSKPNATWTIPGLANRRDFIDVRDVARALIALGHKGKPGQVYHIGSGVSRSIGEGLEILARLAGCHAELIEDPENRGSGPTDSVADIRRIIHDTLWRPEVDFETSLRELWTEIAREPRTQALNEEA